MPHYPYLIVGGGMTADAAIGGIREVDPRGSVGLLGADSHNPYDRPPLSKGLWKGKPLESIWRKTASEGVTLHLGRQARALESVLRRPYSQWNPSSRWIRTRRRSSPESPCRCREGQSRRAC